MKKDAKRHGTGPVYLLLTLDAEVEIEAADPDIWGVLLGEKISKLGAQGAFGMEILGMRVIWGQDKFEAKREISRPEMDRYEKQFNAIKKEE